jgi:hypothetical protein
MLLLVSNQPRRRKYQSSNHDPNHIQNYQEEKTSPDLVAMETTRTNELLKGSWKPKLAVRG